MQLNVDDCYCFFWTTFLLPIDFVPFGLPPFGLPPFCLLPFGAAPPFGPPFDTPALAVRSDPPCDPFDPFDDAALDPLYFVFVALLL